MKTQQELEHDLDSFDGSIRRNALTELSRISSRPAPLTNVNMHIHSFFSFNAQGFSPSRIAWEARKAGLYAAGLCDFDVLDGLQEFLEAGLILGLRTIVSVETRAYLRERGDVDINSPGEPGVIYVMGAGFAFAPEPDSPEGRTLAFFRRTASERNEELVERINSRLAAVAIDYHKDVLPLTPSGSATERHIVRAYVLKAKKAFGADESGLLSFWAGALGKNRDEIAGLIESEVRVEEAVRAGLVKRGGIGYKQPTTDTFPPAGDFLAWARLCGAIPMATWLDGTAKGERDAVPLLECMRDKGAAALNVIPDRNWNFPDPAVRTLKLSKLSEVVNAAEQLGMPVNIGTEMNRAGLPFTDDLDGEALRPYRNVFLKGARIMVGHTLLLRYAGLSYAGPRAEAEFGGNVWGKNRFFERVGALPPLTVDGAMKLEDMGEEKALAWFRELA